MSQFRNQRGQNAIIIQRFQRMSTVVQIFIQLISSQLKQIRERVRQHKKKIIFQVFRMRIQYVSCDFLIEFRLSIMQSWSLFFIPLIFQMSLQDDIAINHFWTNFIAFHVKKTECFETDVSMLDFVSSK